MCYFVHFIIEFDATRIICLACNAVALCAVQGSLHCNIRSIQSTALVPLEVLRAMHVEIGGGSVFLLRVGALCFCLCVGSFWKGKTRALVVN